MRGVRSPSRLSLNGPQHYETDAELLEGAEGLAGGTPNPASSARTFRNCCEHGSPSSDIPATQRICTSVPRRADRGTAAGSASRCRTAARDGGPISRFLATRPSTMLLATQPIDMSEIVRDLTEGLTEEDFKMPSGSSPKRRGKSTTAKRGKERAGSDVVCSICLKEESENQQSSIPMGTIPCKHKFCFPCIKEWAEVDNRCPLCKAEIHFITNNTTLQKVAVEKKRRAPDAFGDVPSEFDDYSCQVCRLQDNPELLLLCDNCDGDGAHHTYCLRPRLDGVPDGDWYCPRCLEDHPSLGVLLAGGQSNVPASSTPRPSIARGNEESAEIPRRRVEGPAAGASTIDLENEAEDSPVVERRRRRLRRADEARRSNIDSDSDTAGSASSFEEEDVILGGAEGKSEDSEESESEDEEKEASEVEDSEEEDSEGEAEELEDEEADLEVESSVERNRRRVSRSKEAQGRRRRNSGDAIPLSPRYHSRQVCLGLRPVPVSQTDTEPKCTEVLGPRRSRLHRLLDGERMWRGGLGLLNNTDDEEESGPAAGRNTYLPDRKSSGRAPGGRARPRNSSADAGKLVPVAGRGPKRKRTGANGGTTEAKADVGRRRKVRKVPDCGEPVSNTGSAGLRRPADRRSNANRHTRSEDRCTVPTSVYYESVEFYEAGPRVPPTRQTSEPVYYEAGIEGASGRRKPSHMNRKEPHEQLRLKERISSLADKGCRRRDQQHPGSQDSSLGWRGRTVY
eukprot:GHVU01070803.1.p1 GENE.GHVU01070803.1~~GHVU01070803.1.p1  ORF type:complete len:738 (-),score=62.68 GHVU01070803.1:2308-4521(-)